jgi:hypothetical protein
MVRMSATEVAKNFSAVISIGSPVSKWPTG